MCFESYSGAAYWQQLVHTTAIVVLHIRLHFPYQYFCVMLLPVFPLFTQYVSSH